MKPVISAAESRRLDTATGTPVGVLMDRAGYHVSVAAARLGVGYGSRVIILAGSGNNGGDGYVAARYLRRRGAAVRVLMAGAPADPQSAAGMAADAAVMAGVRVEKAANVDPSQTTADLIIDALFGVGFHGELPPWVGGWAGHDAPVLAVDLPSGLDADTGHAAVGTLQADVSLTFHALKPGHVTGPDRRLCGKVGVVDIGLVGEIPDFFLCEAVDAPLPSRHHDAHKWSVGSVLVVGGSTGLIGAAILTATSAIEFGAGAVTLACPAMLQDIVATAAPGITSLGVGTGQRFADEDAAEVAAAAGRFDVIVVGPGLGSGMHAFVAALMDDWPGRLILDADGLNALGGPDLLVRRSGRTIITPHLGEFARLVGGDVDPGRHSAADLAGTTGTVVVLKGGPTFIAGDDLWAVESGGPELASIGTGDVLAGMIAALWARGLPDEVAARSGAYWHGVAGAAVAGRGQTVTAERLRDAIGEFAS